MIFQEQKEPKGMPQTEWQKKQTITHKRGRKRKPMQQVNWAKTHEKTIVLLKNW